MKYFERERQEWIAETLRVFGFIQRKHLMLKFGISMPQASADLQTFLAANPRSIQYDPHRKRYVLLPGNDEAEPISSRHFKTERGTTKRR